MDAFQQSEKKSRRGLFGAGISRALKGSFCLGTSANIIFYQLRFAIPEEQFFFHVREEDILQHLHQMAEGLQITVLRVPKWLSNWFFMAGNTPMCKLDIALPAELSTIQRLAKKTRFHSSRQVLFGIL